MRFVSWPFAVCEGVGPAGSDCHFSSIGGAKSKEKYLRKEMQ